MIFGKGGENLQKHKPSVLVCVTGQRDCDRLIRVGKEISDQRSLSLQILCVEPTSAGFDANCEELEYLRQTARDAGAEMSVYFHDDAPLMAVGVAKKFRSVQLVTGMTEAPVNGFIEIIHKLLPHIPIAMVAKDGVVYNIFPENSKKSKPKRKNHKILFQN